MRKHLILAAMMSLAIVPTVVNATTFGRDVTSCVDISAETRPDGSALIHYQGSDPRVIWHYAAGLSEYAPDEDESGAVDKHFEPGGYLEGNQNHVVVPISQKALALGLRGFNNIDGNKQWGPLPHRYVRIHFGNNLIYQNSTDPSGTGSEDGRGGHYLTYIGDLTPEQAAKYKAEPYNGGQACEAPKVASAPPAPPKPAATPAPAPQKKAAAPAPCVGGGMNNNKDSAVAKDAAVSVNRSSDVSAAAGKSVQKNKLRIGRGATVNGSVKQTNQAVNGISIKGHGNNVVVNFSPEGKPIFEDKCRNCHNTDSWRFNQEHKTYNNITGPSKK